VISNIGYICRINTARMNLQDIIYPIRDLILWTFELLKAGSDLVNNAIIIIIALALVYWTVKLVGFQKDEVANR
jgi:hypothetical protein